MRPIRFVYFDLGNVLLAFDPKVACANVASLFQISPSLAEEVIYTSGLEPKLERGELTGEAFAAEVRRRLRQRDGRVAVDAVGTDELLHAISDMFTPIVSMMPALAGVRRAGLGMGILSNTCAAHWEFVLAQAYPLLAEPFDVYVLSHEVRAMKPDAAIYDAAERLSGAAPDEILFLDDRHENVDAAIRRGWRASQCFGGDGAIEALARHGLGDFVGSADDVPARHERTVRSRHD